LPAAESISASLAKSKTIRGELYVLRLLPVEASEEGLVRLIELLGPAVVDTLSSDAVLGVIAGAAKADRAVDAALLAEVAKPLADAARGVIGRLRSTDISYFAGLFKQQTKVGSGKHAQPLADCYDVHFAGKLGALREWLTWCLMEHYADFFVGGGAMQSALAAVRSAAQAKGDQPE
jgi:hypothetical protein